MDKKKYAVDRIEGNIIVLESITDGHKVQINTIDGLNIEEGDILIYENGEYHKDMELKDQRMKSIEERMKRLRDE